MSGRKLIYACLVALALGLTAAPAYAHGFGQRYDLPIPLDYFLFGAGATVALSFLVIGLFVRGGSSGFRYPRYNLLAAGRPSGLLATPFLLVPVRALAVALFLLVIATALFGAEGPIENLAPTMVWVIWWVGMGYIVALLGNLWALINPWKAIFEAGSRLMGGDAGSGRRETALFRYPEWLDVWPALLLFLLFAWLENVYTGAAQPLRLGLIVLLYSIVTLAGMAAFGKHTWLRHGEAFTVLFGFFSRFSPTEVRASDPALCRTCDSECGRTEAGCVDCYQCFEAAAPGHRELNLRPFAVGLAHPDRVSVATGIFVILALATVTFDGLTATPGWVDFQTAVYSAASSIGANPVTVIDTVGLVLLPVVFIGVFLLFSWGIQWLAGERVPVPDVARGFVFSLVPIALAYNLAHFLSFLLIQGQLILPLASDPFGWGWDLFGTAGYGINIGVINAKIVWYISVAAIVVAHIISIYIAHVIALRRTPDRAMALRGQYPMMVLMVMYTATSLWIIAQPIVE